MNDCGPRFLADDDWERPLAALKALRRLLAEESFEVTAKLPFPGGVLDAFLEPANLRAWYSGDRNSFHHSAIARAYRWRLTRQYPRAAALHELFTVGESGDEEHTTALLGRHLLNQLVQADVLESFDGRLRTNVLAVPMSGLLCVGDPVRWQEHPEYVYAGRSSFSAADYLSAWDWRPARSERSLPRRLLDLGCGAGFAAVAAAAGGVEQVLGSDVVERCLRFGRLNAAINDLTNVDFVRSDLFDDVAGDFDLIVSNTPCVWEELQQATFATGGGAFGTELPMRMLSESLEHLRTGGLLVVIVAAPLIRGRPYVREAVVRACAGRPVEICIHPLFSEYEYAHATAYRGHGITQFVRYLIAVSPADRLSVTFAPSNDLRFVCYRSRAAAVRLAARLTTISP